MILPPKGTTIYALSHPETGEVRYIGKTSDLPRRRMARHVFDALHGTSTRQPHARQDSNAVPTGQV
jgi:hypothetical protein